LFFVFSLKNGGDNDRINLMKSPLNLSYTSVHGTYWMYSSVILSFSSVFLLSKGYTNSEIGVVLAIANIVSFVLQPALADLIDRSKKITLSIVTQIMVVFLLLGTLSLIYFPGKSFSLSTIYMLLAALHIAVQPMINAMAFHYSDASERLNFGIARGGGSVAFAGISSILGALVVAFGTTSIPVTGVVLLTLFLVSLIGLDRLYHRMTVAQPSKSGSFKPHVDASPITLVAFVRRNKVFVIFSFAVLLIYFQNVAINNYLIQILSAVGGRSDQMGRLLSFMALLELPGLFFFSRIRFWFSCQFMLKVASIGFILKVLFTYLATSVGFVYFAFLFQLVSFPFFLSASVHLVDEIMEKGEAVKGQSLLTAMITLSAVFASLFGGMVLDISGPSQLLLVSTLTTVIGTIMVFLFVDKIKSNKT